jgi:hypothetical protein
MMVSGFALFDASPVVALLNDFLSASTIRWRGASFNKVP